MSNRSIGTQGNLWDAASVAINGVSAIIQIEFIDLITIFGNTSATTTLTVQYSQDGTNFYDSDITIAANGNFSKTIDIAAIFIRVKSSLSATITATLAGKGR